MKAQAKITPEVFRSQKTWPSDNCVCERFPQAQWERLPRCPRQSRPPRGRSTRCPLLAGAPIRSATEGKQSWWSSTSRYRASAVSFSCELNWKEDPTYHPNSPPQKAFFCCTPCTLVPGVRLLSCSLSAMVAAGPEGDGRRPGEGEGLLLWQAAGYWAHLPGERQRKQLHPQQDYGCTLRHRGKTNTQNIKNLCLGWTMYLPNNQL